jgi:uncharacterized protein
MPWHVGEQGSHGCDGYPVVKDGTDEVEGCHDTREQANRQVAALYANEPEAGRAEMKVKSINDLPDSAFAYIEPGGSKDEQGKTVPRSKRHFPIHDAAHVRNALARAPQSPFGKQAMPKILAAAKKFGIEVGDRSASVVPFERVNHADLSIRSDGRTVYGIVMPYDSETQVNDGDGPYIEVFRKGSFARSIQHRGDRIKLNVNHDKYKQLPIGRSTNLREDAKGLYGEFRVSDTEAGNETLTLIRDEVADSFSAGFIPIVPGPRDPIPKTGVVERSEVKLDHVSVVAFPAYEDARITGVRFDFAEFWDQLSPEEQEATRHLDLYALIRSAAQQHAVDTSDGPATDGTPDELEDDPAETSDPPIEPADRTSDGHSPPIQFAQRPVKTPERLQEEFDRVKARVAAAIAKER